jgi:D-alanyl-D-alanine carboxypeptidase
LTGVKCTVKQKKKKRNMRKRRSRCTGILSIILVLLCASAGAIGYYKVINAKPETLVYEYEKNHYKEPLYRAESLYAEELCAASKDIYLEGVSDMTGIHAAALFDVNGKNVDFSRSIHERLYPASTTKILTALVAINNGNLSDSVIISENAAASSFAADEQVCGLETGDVFTLGDLLYGLILNSGNDNAVAVAEHIAGSEEAFADMMNEQAVKLMATNSHFMNASGLHNEEHYTTAYDLYLIFNECIKHQEFLDMISASSYTAYITKADGTAASMEFHPTNYYANGSAALPSGASVIGGKTGTTDQAGNCLILLDEDMEQNRYISVIMGAETKEILYMNMTSMIDAIPRV